MNSGINMLIIIDKAWTSFHGNNTNKQTFFDFTK